MSLNIRKTTKRHTPEKLNLQQHLCENLKSRKRLSSGMWRSMALMGKVEKLLKWSSVNLLTTRDEI